MSYNTSSKRFASSLDSRNGRNYPRKRSKIEATKDALDILNKFLEASVPNESVPIHQQIREPQSAPISHIGSRPDFRSASSDQIQRSRSGSETSSEISADENRSSFDQTKPKKSLMKKAKERLRATFNIQSRRQSQQDQSPTDSEKSLGAVNVGAMDGAKDSRAANIAKALTAQASGSSSSKSVPRRPRSRKRNRSESSRSEKKRSVNFDNQVVPDARRSSFFDRFRAKLPFRESDTSPRSDTSSPQTKRKDVAGTPPFAAAKAPMEPPKPVRKKASIVAPVHSELVVPPPRRGASDDERPRNVFDEVVLEIQRSGSRQTSSGQHSLQSRSNSADGSSHHRVVNVSLANVIQRGGGGDFLTDGRSSSIGSAAPPRSTLAHPARASMDSLKRASTLPSGAVQPFSPATSFVPSAPSTHSTLPASTSTSMGSSTLPSGSSKLPSPHGSAHGSASLTRGVSLTRYTNGSAAPHPRPTILAADSGLTDSFHSSDGGVPVRRLERQISEDSSEIARITGRHGGGDGSGSDVSNMLVETDGFPKPNHRHSYSDSGPANDARQGHHARDTVSLGNRRGVGFYRQSSSSSPSSLARARVVGSHVTQPTLIVTPPSRSASESPTIDGLPMAPPNGVSAAFADIREEEENEDDPTTTTAPVSGLSSLASSNPCSPRPPPLQSGLSTVLDQAHITDTVTSPRSGSSASATLASSEPTSLTPTLDASMRIAARTSASRDSMRLDISQPHAPATGAASAADTNNNDAAAAATDNDDVNRTYANKTDAEREEMHRAIARRLAQLSDQMFGRSGVLSPMSPAADAVDGPGGDKTTQLGYDFPYADEDDLMTPCTDLAHTFRNISDDINQNPTMRNVGEILWDATYDEFARAVSQVVDVTQPYRAVFDLFNFTRRSIERTGGRSTEFANMVIDYAIHFMDVENLINYFVDDQFAWHAVEDSCPSDFELD